MPSQQPTTSSSLESELALQRRSSDTYHYNPIEPGEIRILILEPGSGTDPIGCSLEKAHLSQDQYYEAISYCWGDPTKTHRIYCDHRPLAITKTLYEALWQFRQRDRPRRLWADAVCIDQANTAERNMQVEKMHEVYSTAEKVLVWLGPEVESDGFVFETIRAIHSRLLDAEPDLTQSTYMKWSAIVHGVEEKRNAFVDRHKGIIDAEIQSLEAHRAFGFLAERPVFSRAWVVQEIALARDPLLCCGSQTMNYDDFANVFDFVRTAMMNGLHWQYLGGKLSLIADTRIGFRTSTESLLSGVLALRTFECSNSLDFAYAARGLLATDLRSAIPVDYSLKPTELYHRILTNAFQRKTIDGLWDCIVHGNSGSTLDGEPVPSWVPDVTGEPKYNDVLIRTLYDTSGARMSDDCELVWIENSNILVVRGVFVTSVHVTSPLLEPPASAQLSTCDCCSYEATRLFARETFYALQYPTKRSSLNVSCDDGRNTLLFNLRSALSFVVRLLRNVFDVISSVPATSLSDEQIWTALYRDYNSSTQTRFQRGVNRVPCLANIWFRLMQTSPDLGNRDNWMPEHPTIKAMSQDDIDNLFTCYDAIKDQVEWSIHRRFGKTETGQLAWVPFDARRDDKICVMALEDAYTPVVIRSDGNGCFKIIGCAYVHGIMDGEAIPEYSDDLVDIRIS